MIGVVSVAVAREENDVQFDLVLVAGGYTESNVIDAMKFVFGKKANKLWNSLALHYWMECSNVTILPFVRQRKRTCKTIVLTICTYIIDSLHWSKQTYIIDSAEKP